jgi:Tol biopolymer transport system component
MKPHRTVTILQRKSSSRRGTISIFAALAAFLLASCLAIFAASPAASVTPFAPGAISTTAPGNMAPAFTPDGNAVYFTEAIGSTTESILVSTRAGGRWSAPELAPFSGQYRDLEPAFSPDGKYLIFASSRPAAPRAPQLDGHYNGQVYKEMGGNLWKVEREKSGWKKPERLPDSINSNGSVFSPAITADGALYFMRAENGGKFHIYRAQMNAGKYETPVVASFSDPENGEYDPAVSRDESYLVFASKRPPAPGVTDLFVVFRSANGWSDPIDLRTAMSSDVHGVEARFSPDGKTLYFSNSRMPSGANNPNGSTIWQVDISEVLRAHGVTK